MKDNGIEKVMHEGFGDNKGKIQLEIEKCIFEPIWRSDISGSF